MLWLIHALLLMHVYASAVTSSQITLESYQQKSEEVDSLREENAKTLAL